jgi:hypothetical protein
MEGQDHGLLSVKRDRFLHDSVIPFFCSQECKPGSGCINVLDPYDPFVFIRVHSWFFLFLPYDQTIFNKRLLASQLFT